MVCKVNLHDTYLLGEDKCERLSSWKNLVTAVACLQHIASSYHEEQRKLCRGWHVWDESKGPDSYACAQYFICRESQRVSFPSEVSPLSAACPLEWTSLVLALHPFMDEEGIIRVGGRLRKSALSIAKKHPILISGKYYIATLIVRRTPGSNLTEGAVRTAGFWITGGKRLISKIVNKCVKCRRLRAKLCTQMMADLPADRLTSSPPFTFIGVDLFGPWQVVTRCTRGGATYSKHWAVMFTCLGCCGIHIELVEEMSSSSFINVLWRFQPWEVKEYRTVAELNINSVHVGTQQWKISYNAPIQFGSSKHPTCHTWVALGRAWLESRHGSWTQCCWMLKATCWLMRSYRHSCLRSAPL